MFAKRSEKPMLPDTFRCWNGTAGCAEAIEIRSWNLSTHLCNNCSAKIAKAVGCDYDSTGMAITARKNENWYKAKYAWFTDISSERRRVRVLMLAAGDTGVQEVHAEEAVLAQRLVRECTSLTGKPIIHLKEAT